ncbi:Ferredoxin--NADP reductase [Pandoraea communis]|uniref:Ferredoxin--NADP reductase n=2 Tax=Pandoraea communis TaxID=2508297 RepID=A0A5E4YH57_9BURK|nr:Ferredoxin--NADP reductase [Pandoraea communis]
MRAMEKFDVAIVGAGAAGLMCAAVAGQLGLRVVLIDHATRLAEKIRISGGGRCNFTNINAGPANYLSENPRFCRSALARYTPRDFLDLLKRHRIAWHEKHRGQLFCDDSAEDIIQMLRQECAAGHVHWRMPCAVHTVAYTEAGGAHRYHLTTDAGHIAAKRLVIATGGLSIPKIGATDWGYRIARQFDLEIVEPRPALVPLMFDASTWAPFAGLSGLSLEVEVSTGKGKEAGSFVEDLLFTHRGLSGPAILQISSFWTPGQPITLDLAPSSDIEAALFEAKATSKRQLANLLAQWVPARLADAWVANSGLSPHARVQELPDKALRSLAQTFSGWTLKPCGSEGWRKAEVTRGGVDTRALSSATMEARTQPGLYFVGEVVDVTGWLGGYNFQWAWASAVACARAMSESVQAGRAGENALS